MKILTSFFEEIVITCVLLKKFCLLLSIPSLSCYFFKAVFRNGIYSMYLRVGNMEDLNEDIFIIY